MKKSTKWVILFFIIALLSFMLSPSMQRLLSSNSYYGIRINIMYLSGTIGIILMSFAVIISAKFSFINNLFGGLDKAYNVHKLSAGIGFTFGIIHYLLSKTNKILISTGIIEAPAPSVNPLTGNILQLYKASYTFLEPAFLLLILVVAVAIFKAIPYHIFKYTHKAIPVLYLFLVFHATFTPLRGGWFGTAGGLIMHCIIFIGTISAFISIFNLIGLKHKHKGIVKNINDIGNDILELHIALNAPLKYQAGQFVFLKFKHSLEAHPFSIASYSSNNILKFYIKKCGDFTNQLQSNINVDDAVNVEGPYGQFIFNDDKRQVWIAGGIGITPFLARLEYLADNKHNQEIDLLYSNKGLSPLEDNIRELCKKAGVNLILIDTDKSGILTFDKIKEILPNMLSSSIWFCGPAGFRKTVEKGLKKDNYNLSDIHYDIFMFR